MFILKYLTALMTEDPTRDLKEEHQHFRALLKAAKKTTVRSKARREALFADMDALLSLHEDVEEKVLYAMLKRHTETKAIVLEGLQEHHVCDVLAKELRSMSVTHKDWGSKFHVLGESLEHHLDEEEKNMKARKNQRSPHRMMLINY